MDENSLELTMECQKDLAEVRDAKSLTKFLENYGTPIPQLACASLGLTKEW